MRNWNLSSRAQRQKVERGSLAAVVDALCVNLHVAVEVEPTYHLFSSGSKAGHGLLEDECLRAEVAYVRAAAGVDHEVLREVALLQTNAINKLREDGPRVFSDTQSLSRSHSQHGTCTRQPVSDAKHALFSIPVTSSGDCLTTLLFGSME